MDTNINIIFQDGGAVGSEADPTCPGSTPNPDAPEQTKKQGKEKDNALTATKAMALYVGKQAFNMVTSRVGAVTRSNIKQAQVNAAVKTIGYGATFIGSLATQNYLAAALTVLSFGVETINSSIDYNEKARTERVGLSIAGKRAGSINRSR